MMFPSTFKLKEVTLWLKSHHIVLESQKQVKLNTVTELIEYNNENKSSTSKTSTWELEFAKSQISAS